MERTEIKQFSSHQNKITYSAYYNSRVWMKRIEWISSEQVNFSTCQIRCLLLSKWKMTPASFSHTHTDARERKKLDTFTDRYSLKKKKLWLNFFIYSNFSKKLQNWPVKLWFFVDRSNFSNLKYQLILLHEIEWN